MKTLQETFDKVVAHLRKQGPTKNIQGEIQCLYRTNSGQKCAAGCLIPDEEYLPAMEGVICTVGLVKENLQKHGYDTNLVRYLQSVHDNYRQSFWEEEFEIVAKRFGLTYTSPAWEIIMSKQLVFPHPIEVTKLYPDGRQEAVRFGQYEAVMIVTENGWPVNRTKKLHAGRYGVTEVECEDGTTLLFDLPFYTIEKSGYGP